MTNGKTSTITTNIYLLIKETIYESAKGEICDLLKFLEDRFIAFEPFETKFVKREAKNNRKRMQKMVCVLCNASQNL